jgi:hypothetical protein
MRYEQIKPLLDEQVLDEVKMSPSALQKFANSPEAEGMLMGIEFEMGVPNAQTEDDGYGEYDYDQNQSAYSIEEIINFFRNGEHSSMGRSEADRLSSQMWEQFLDWQSGQIYENIDDNELNSRIRSRLEDDYTVDDYIEAAREELGDDAPDSDVEDRAVELRDDAITEIITVGDGRDYQYAYDLAREELEEEMRDDGDYDQEAWLRDIGIDDMQDAEREWGLDWPHMNYNSGGDVSVDDVADDFAEAMGVAKVITSTGYHGARRDGVSWIIEPDSSIDADDGDGGLEFVSPPMPIKDGLEMIKKFKAWASSYGCYTNSSTGLHMNISVPDMTIEKLDYVKLALFLGDEYVLKEFDRQYNSYAKSAMKIVKEKIQQNPENATALLAKMKEHLNTAASKLVHTGITNKYTSINTKENYVEFRGPGGDYLEKDPLELINTALRLAMSLRIATDESAYKQEYAKKLYKLIGPKDGDWTDPNNSVALFSRYALGEIDKTELVNNVRQAQTARREKKGDKDLQYWVMNRDESGGKQMVYARSETDAIILGGKQMGLDREQSIRQLKAELVYRQDMPMPRTVPEKWQYWVKETLPNISGDILASIRQKLADNEYELDPLANSWLLRQVDNELRSRMDADDTPDSGETRWKVSLVRGRYEGQQVEPIYINADTPRQAKLTAQSMFSRQLGSAVEYDDLEVEEAASETGETSEGFVRWKVSIARGEYADRPIDAVFIDAPTPRNAKVAAQAIFRSQLGSFVEYEDLEAIATTPDAGRETTTNTTSREVFDSLPESWQTWLSTGLSNSTGEELQRDIDAIANGTNPNVRDLSIEQRDAIIGTINLELRRRNSSREARNSLSQAWQTWLDQVHVHASETLENMLDTIDAGTGDVERMTPDQRNLIIITINQELRSRQTTNYNTLAANAARAENIVFQSLPAAHREWLSEVSDKSDMDLINVLRNLSAEHNDSILSDQQKAYFRITIKHELRRRGINADAETQQDPAAQQQQALLPDDPVTSNDPEATDGPGMWMVGNHTYGRETFQANSREEAIQAYAERNGIDDIEAFKAERSFVAQLANRPQTNESINTIRKLAGLA